MSGVSPVSCVPYQPVDQTPPTTGPASADLNGDGVLDPFEQQQAAVSLAPVLYFAPGEENFLQDPMTYIEESSLRQELDWRGDREVHDEGDVPPEELAGIDDGNPDADSQLFLDHSDDHRAGDNDNSALLYEYDADSNTITYHLFYSYNDGPPGLGDVQNHEGDWERVTIQLDDQFRPSEVRYSAHSGLDVSRAWPGAENTSGQPVATLENGKPVVYVAQGSHANLPETGEWSTQVDGIHDLAAYDPETSVRLDLGTRPARDVTAEPWYGGYVLWGERGSAQEFGVGETSGPTGPSESKGPITDATPREPLSEQEADTPPWWLPHPIGPVLPPFS